MPTIAFLLLVDAVGGQGAGAAKTGPLLSEGRGGERRKDARRRLRALPLPTRPRSAQTRSSAHVLHQWCGARWLHSGRPALARHTRRAGGTARAGPHGQREGRGAHWEMPSTPKDIWFLPPWLICIVRTAAAVSSARATSHQCPARAPAREPGPGEPGCHGGRKFARERAAHKRGARRAARSAPRSAGWQCPSGSARTRGRCSRRGAGTLFYSGVDSASQT